MSKFSHQRNVICPPWCELPPGHVADVGAAGEIIHKRMVRETYLTGIEAIRHAADEPVRVEVEAYSDPAGREHAPTIRLTLSSGSDADDPGADDLTPAEARELAAALFEAARLADSQ